MELPIYIKVYPPEGGGLTAATDKIRRDVQTGFTKGQGGGGGAGGGGGRSRRGALDVVGAGEGERELKQATANEVARVKYTTLMRQKIREREISDDVNLTRWVADAKAKESRKRIQDEQKSKAIEGRSLVDVARKNLSIQEEDAVSANKRLTSAHSSQKKSARDSASVFINKEALEVSNANIKYKDAIAANKRLTSQALEKPFKSAKESAGVFIAEQTKEAAKSKSHDETTAAISTALYAGGREAGVMGKLPMGVSLPLARYATRLTAPIVAGIEAIGIGTAAAIGVGLAAAGVAGVVAYKSWQAREEGQIAYGMQNVLTGASRYMGGASQVSDVAARGTFSKMMGLPGHWLTGSRDAATMGLVSSYTSMPGAYNKGDYSNFATTAKLRGDETGEKLSGQFGKEFTGTDTAFAAGQQSRWIAMQSMASRMNPGEENPALAQAAMAQRELISENRMAWERASTIGMQEHSMDMSHEIQKGIKEEKVKGDSYLSLQSETRKTEQIKAALISNPTLRAQANELIAVQEGQAEKNAINFDVAQKNTALLKAQTNEASEQQDYARKLADYTKDPTITTQGKGPEQIEEDFRKSEKGKDALKKLRESQVTTATAGKTYNLALTSQLDQMAAIEEKVEAGKKGRGVTEAYTTMQTGLETNAIIAKSAESQLQIASGQRGVGLYGQAAAAYTGKQIATGELIGQRSGLQGFQKETGIDQTVNIDRVNQQIAASQWEEQTSLKDVYFTAGRTGRERMSEKRASRLALRQERRGQERLEGEFGEYRRTGGKGEFNDFINTREQGAGTPGQATNELLSFTSALKSATATLASFRGGTAVIKNKQRIETPVN